MRVELLFSALTLSLKPVMALLICCIWLRASFICRRDWRAMSRLRELTSVTPVARLEMS